MSGPQRATGLRPHAKQAYNRGTARVTHLPGGASVRCLQKPPPPRNNGARSLRHNALALSVERISVLEPAAPVADAYAGAEPRLRIAVDVDEVLGRFVHALNGFCKVQYGMSYDVSDYWIYEFAKIWGCNQDRSNHIVHEFFKSPHFNDGIPIMPGAYSTLQCLGEWCDLMVVTSRQHLIQDATLEWLDRHYPGTFQEVYFGNHFALEGASRKKSDICASIGAQVLIDDNVGYALDCASSGIQVLLFDWESSYPWSKPPPGFEHPNIRIVRNWREVEAALKVLAAPVGQLSSDRSLGHLSRL